MTHRRAPRWAIVGTLAIVAVGVVLAGRIPPAVALPRIVAVGATPSAVVVDAGKDRVFVTDHDDASVSMLDATSGTVVRTVKLPAAPGSAAVDEQTGRVFVVCSAVIPGNLSIGSVDQSSGHVSLLDAQTGDLLRTVAVGPGAYAIAVDRRSGHVFVTNSGDDSVSVLDARARGVIRTIAVGAYPRSVAVDGRNGRVFVANFVGNTVSVLDASSTRVLRTVRVGLSPYPLVIDEQAGRVFVVNQDSRSISMLDAGTGRVLRTIPGLGDPIAIDEPAGHVFAANPTGVAMLSAHTGAPLLAIPTSRAPAVLAMAADAQSGRLFVVTGTGLADPSSLRVLDGTTGQLVRAFPLRIVPEDVLPIQVAVDAPAGRVFIANQGTATQTGSPPSDGPARLLASWWRRWLRWLPSPLPAPQAPPAPVPGGSVSVLDAKHQ